MDSRMLGRYKITLEDKNFNNYKFNDVQNDRIRLETYFQDLELVAVCDHPHCTILYAFDASHPDDLLP